MKCSRVVILTRRIENDEKRIRDKLLKKHKSAANVKLSRNAKVRRHN